MKDESSQRRRLRLQRGAVILAAAAALAMAACSGSSSAGSPGGAPPAGGSAGPSSRPGDSSTAVRPISQRKQLAYSQCMRSHGVPGVPTSFPSPVPGKPPSKPDFRAVQANGPNPGSPRWEAAQQACRSLMPAPVEVPG
jgi:hypothetical protein